jgi:hypothetical protein
LVTFTITIQPEKKNILVVGQFWYSEMVVPLLSPDPATNKNVSYLKYPIYVGGNRGRGQVYPEMVVNLTTQYITHTRFWYNLNSKTGR